MPFDAGKFCNEQRQPRTQDVPVSHLKEYFQAGEPAAWRVRGLTGQEFSRARFAADEYGRRVNLLEGLATAATGAEATAIREMLAEDAGRDIAMRMTVFTLGSMSPVADDDMARAMLRDFPVEFFRITDASLALTGMGHEPGKSKPSGGSPE